MDSREKKAKEEYHFYYLSRITKMLRDGKIELVKNCWKNEPTPKLPKRIAHVKQKYSNFFKLSALVMLNWNGYQKSQEKSFHARQSIPEYFETWRKF